jgi:hypothetical protein
LFSESTSFQLECLTVFAFYRDRAARSLRPSARRGQALLTSSAAAQGGRRGRSHHQRQGNARGRVPNDRPLGASRLFLGASRVKRRTEVGHQAKGPERPCLRARRCVRSQARPVWAIQEGASRVFSCCFPSQRGTRVRGVRRRQADGRGIPAERTLPAAFARLGPPVVGVIPGQGCAAASDRAARG